jgi:hypothetical protein
MKPGQHNSDEAKPKQRGGKRPGAGRKPNLAKRKLRGFSTEAIAEAVSGIDLRPVINGLLKSKRELTRLETLRYLSDRLLGRPVQQQVTVGLTLEQRIFGMTDEQRDARINELLELLNAYRSKPVVVQ